MSVGRKRSYLWYVTVLFSLAILLGLVCVSDSISADAQDADSAELRLIFTTDIHGQLTGYNYEQGTEYAGGLSKLYGVIEKARQEAGADAYLTFDIGDVLYDVTTEYIISQDPEVLQPVYQAMSLIGYDAITLGNHDFDYGYDYIMNQLQASGLIEKTVVSNITDSKTGEHPFGENMMITKTLITESGKEAEVKIGVIGETIPKLSAKTESYTGVLKGEDIVKNVETQAANLKAQGADIVVVLSHSGFGPESPEENYKNVSYALTRIDDVDVILCGHEHNTFPDESKTTNYYKLPGVDKETGLVNGKLIIMANDRARSIGIADLTFTVHDDGSVELTGQESEVRKVSSGSSENEIIAGLYGDWEADLRKYCEDIIAEVDEENPLQNYFGLFEDTAAIQLLNDAKKSYAMKYINTTKPQYADLPIVAVSTYGSYGEDGAADYADISGEITEAGLGALQSYNSYVNIYKITGKQLKEWLEWAASAYEQINSDSTWTAGEMTGLMERTGLKPLIKQDWMEVWSNFFVFDGIDYTITPSIAARYDLTGNRINTSYRVSNIKYNGEAVTDTMEFIIVTDRITQPKDATLWADTQLVYGGYNRSQTIVTDYVKLLAKSGTVSVTPDNNWHIKLPAKYSFLVTASTQAADHTKLASWNEGFLLAAEDYDYYKGTLNYTENDTSAPNVVIKPMTTDPTRTSYDVLVDATDASGIAKLKYQSGDVGLNDVNWNIARDITDGKLTVYFNGTYTIYAEDKLGNSRTFQFKVDNIGTDVLGMPVVETYTNRKTSIKGTAELGTVVKIETPDKTYETQTTSLGTFSYKLPSQKSGTVIYVYAEEIDTGRVSDKVKIRVKRTGPEKPSANKYYNNSTGLTGKTNDEDGNIIVISGSTVYVPENGGTELFTNSAELYDKKYNIVEVPYTSDQNGNFSLSLPAQQVGTTLTVYNLDHLSRKSISVSVKVAEGGPYPPNLYEVTDIEKSVSGVVSPVSSNKVFTVYGIVNGTVYSVKTDKNGAFTLKFPNEELKAGDQIVMYATDTDGGKTRKSVNAVYSIKRIEDFVDPASYITIYDLDYTSDSVSGSYKSEEEIFISVPTRGGRKLYQTSTDAGGYFSVDLEAGVSLEPGGYIYAMTRYVDGGIIDAASLMVPLPLPGIPAFAEEPDNTMGIIQILADQFTEKVVLKAGGDEYVLEEYTYNEEKDANVFNIKTGQIKSGTKLTVYAENSTGAGKSVSAKVVRLAPDAPKVDGLTAGVKKITGTVDLLAPPLEEKSEEETGAGKDAGSSDQSENSDKSQPKKPSRTAEEDLSDKEQTAFFKLTKTKIFAKVGGVTYSGTVKADGTFVIEVPEKLKTDEEVTVWAQNYAGKGPESVVTVKKAAAKEK